MWHWLVSALATGVTIVLYDGSPFRPLDNNGVGELAMPKLIEELQITHFGTSAKYLSILEQNKIVPIQSVDLSRLKAIYSTGSPLAPSVSGVAVSGFLLLLHSVFTPMPHLYCLVSEWTQSFLSDLTNSMALLSSQSTRSVADSEAVCRPLHMFIVHLARISI